MEDNTFTNWAGMLGVLFVLFGIGALAVGLIKWGESVKTPPGRLGY